MEYRLLAEFSRVFEGHEYRHRRAGIGDFVAMQLYEDLVALGKSPKLADRVAARVSGLNVQNRRQGINARRGDGAFGEMVPGVAPIIDPGYTVARGPVATIEIGVEVKVLAKAMLKQVDRVITVLTNQVEHFRRGGGTPICVAIVGINWAQEYTSFEGDRSYRTDGRKYLHPYQEAQQAERRLVAEAAPSFDEFLVLRFRATNAPPFPFAWVKAAETSADYGAILTRLCREYDRRF